MRLRYASPASPDELPNFGDLLNPMVFSTLLPGYFDGSHYPDVDLLGIGTILGMLVPERGPSRRTIVFSSGLAGPSSASYGNPPQLNDQLEIVCVRGPLTAALMGVSEGLAITDGAILLRELVPPTGSNYQPKRALLVPHMSSASASSRWEQAAREADVDFLDPRSTDVAQIVQRIQEASVVLAEAMHAAIVADSLGVPWIPVVSNRTISRFKWTDWCKSMDLDYEPVRLPPLLDPFAAKSAIASRLSLEEDSASPRALAEIYNQLVEPASFRLAVRRLKSLAGIKPLLSKEGLRAQKVEQLLEGLEGIRRRYPL